MILDYTILFFASFSLVGLLGLQSKNVQGSKYIAAAVTSVAISIANFFFVKIVATGNYEALIIASIAGACGIITAIYAYDKMNNQKRQKKV